MSTISIILLVLVIVIVVYIAIKFFHGEGLAGIMKIFSGGASKFTLFTQQPWFDEIKSERKTVEARIGDKSKYQDLVGKQIAISAGKENKVHAKVKAVRHYNDLETYLKKEGWKNVAPHVKSEKEALASYLEIKNKAGKQIYGEENVKLAGGIIAIEFILEKK